MESDLAAFLSFSPVAAGSAPGSATSMTLRLCLSGLGQARGEQQDDAGNGEEGNLRQPGDASERDHNAGGDLQRARRDSSCVPRSAERVAFEEARVTTMPPAIETRSEGIRVTRPSPTVSTV